MQRKTLRQRNQSRRNRIDLVRNALAWAVIVFGVFFIGVGLASLRMLGI